MTTLTDQVLRVARAFAAATESDLGSVSYRSLGDSRRLGLLKDGKASTTLRRADEALKWFSANWPADHDWPAGIPRPDHATPPESAAASRAPARCHASS